VHVCKNSTDACKSCPAGTFSVEVGPNSTGTCEMCEPGTFQDEVGQTGCKSCNEGYSQEEGGLGSCNQCDAGPYAQNTGSIKGTPCPYPLSSRAGSKQCPFCKKGFYLNVMLQTLALMIWQRIPQGIAKDVQAKRLACVPDYFTFSRRILARLGEHCHVVPMQ